MKQADIRNACIVYKNIEAGKLLKEGFHLRRIASINLKSFAADT